MIFFCFLIFTVSGQTVIPESKNKDLKGEAPDDKYTMFYDSLKSKAQNKKLTRTLYRFLFPAPSKTRSTTDSSFYAFPLQGKVIGQINIIRLDAFGPSISDTTRKATIWYEKAGNFIHTPSDLHNIRKNLIIKKGEVFRPEDIYENERLLRSLYYIRDARFFASPDSSGSELVNLTLLIQDRFSIGVTGNVSSPKSAALEVYNRNLFGVGHELTVRFVGHLTRQPYTGIETYYRISNISGRFISFSAGYLNTFRNEGAIVRIDKNLLRASDTWGYGMTGHLMKRTYLMPGEVYSLRDTRLGYRQYSLWAGRNIQLQSDHYGSQLTLAGQYIYRHFSERPAPFPNGDQFYFHSSQWLAGITWSKRSYKTDELVYGYGITEDIPRGFKNELVVGYDQAEKSPRWYSNIYLSNGIILREKPGYLFLAGSIGGYLEAGKLRQGLVECSSRFISKLFVAGNVRVRQFVQVEYKKGINRFEDEYLTFYKTNLIRGFDSGEITGKQRLSLNVESVFFQNKDFYRFNLAIFAFGDLGIISSATRPVFQGSYYGGFGVGLRIHNESLVLKTIQLRLSFYPKHPNDVGFIGFRLNEHTRQTFYSFQPEAPAPRRFE